MAERSLYRTKFSWPSDNSLQQSLVLVDPKCDIANTHQHGSIRATFVRAEQDQSRSCAFSLATIANHELAVANVFIKGSLKAVELFKNDSNYIGTFKPGPEGVVAIPVNSKLSKLTLNLVPIESGRFELDCICLAAEITPLSVDEIRARESASSAKVTQMLMMALSKAGPNGTTPGAPTLPITTQPAPVSLPSPVPTPAPAQTTVSPSTTAVSPASNVGLLIQTMQQSILGAIDQLRTDVSTRLERIEARLTALESAASAAPVSKD